MAAIDELAADADYLLARDESSTVCGPCCGSTLPTLKRNQPLTKPLPDEREVKLSAHEVTLVQRCSEAIELLDPEDTTQRRRIMSAIRRDVISVRLAMLCGGFPTGAPGDSEVFVSVMLEYLRHRRFNLPRARCCLPPDHDVAEIFACDQARS